MIDAARFYHSKRWKEARQRILARDRGLCQECKSNGKIKRGSDVDHILPLSDYPHLALVSKNLRTLCKVCHNLKTTADRYGRVQFCVHGYQMDECPACKTGQ